MGRRGGAAGTHRMVGKNKDEGKRAEQTPVSRLTPHDSASIQYKSSVFGEELSCGSWAPGGKDVCIVTEIVARSSYLYNGLLHDKTNQVKV